MRPATTLALGLLLAALLLAGVIQFFVVASDSDELDCSGATPPAACTTTVAP